MLLKDKNIHRIVLESVFQTPTGEKNLKFQIQMIISGRIITLNKFSVEQKYQA